MATNGKLSIWLALLLVAVAMAGPPRADAARSCAADCVRRMVECRSTRCADLPQKPCRDRCRAITGCRAGGARIGTLANVVTSCRVTGTQWTAEQRLETQNGDCPPTTVVRFVPSEPATVLHELCGLFGDFRDGVVAVTVAPLQRIGMSPNGRTILFEVSTEHVVLPGPKFEVPDEQQGIFAVRADGSHLRRLGDASRETVSKGPLSLIRSLPGSTCWSRPSSASVPTVASSCFRIADPEATERTRPSSSSWTCGAASGRR
jgi:hypothetical protein